MKKKPLITIITTTYNQEKYIGACLDGFVMQKTEFPFQAIISDDGSTDQTRKIIQKYAKKYPDIIQPVFREKNLGAMENFVETLNMADTKYVALCDGDDFWTDPEKLQKQVSFLESHPDYNICFHSTKIFFEDHSREDEVIPVTMKETTTFDDLQKECYIPANTVVYRWKFQKKDSLKKIFPKDVVPGDYFVHLYHATDGKIKFINEVMSQYRRHEQGMWWLTSKPEQQEQFHLKYGMKYLHFYKALKDYFGLDDPDHLAQERYIAYQTVRAYLKNNRFDDLAILYKENSKLVEEYMRTLTIDPVYQNLSKTKKLWYLFLIDRSTLSVKIEAKLERFPLLAKGYRFIKKYKEALLYLIFGALTTLVNILTYLLFTRLFTIDTYTSNIIAWIVSVLFAFITNKKFVFQSKDHSFKTMARESLSFLGFRLLSLGIDMGSMYAMISLWKWNDLIAKIIANIIVIVLNYIFSKLFVFTRKKDK